jgi:hypothetical protein
MSVLGSAESAERETDPGTSCKKPLRQRNSRFLSKDPLECPVTRRRRMLIEKRQERTESGQGTRPRSESSADLVPHAEKKRAGRSACIRACIAEKRSEKPPVRRPKDDAETSERSWKISPCISNWKNPKGLVFPLEARIQKKKRFE